MHPKPYDCGRTWCTRTYDLNFLLWEFGLQNPSIRNLLYDCKRASVLVRVNWILSLSEPLFYFGSGIECCMGKQMHVVMRLQPGHAPGLTTRPESDASWTPILLHHPTITKLGFSQGANACVLCRSCTHEAWWGHDIEKAWQAYFVSEALSDRNVHGMSRSCTSSIYPDHGAMLRSSTEHALRLL